jgi:hypothetical protein
MSMIVLPTSLAVRTAHRNQVLETFNRALDLKPEHANLIEEAIVRVTRRLDGGRWTRQSLAPVQWKTRKPGVGRGEVPTITHDEVEFAIVYALARTWPAAQFSVDARGLVFAVQLNGYHRKADRLYVAGLSTILDEAADLQYLTSHGAGGRFYIQNQAVQLADGRSVIARLEPFQASKGPST